MIEKEVKKMKKENYMTILGIENTTLSSRKQIERECLNILESNDMGDNKSLEMFFSNKERYKLIYILENERTIAFAVYEKIISLSIIYIHGIFVKKEKQSMGIGKLLMEEILKNDIAIYIVAKTRNPRIYEIISKYSSKNRIYPNIIYNIFITPVIYYILLNNEYTSKVTPNLRLKENFKEPFQKSRDKRVEEFFAKLEEREFQIIIGHIKNI